MARLSRLTLFFSILFLVFIVGLPFLSRPFGPYPLMKTQDAVDLLTPLVLIPVYWLLYKGSATEAGKRLEDMAFMVLASLWTLGQGMHLSANSVNNLAEGLAKRKVLDILPTDIYKLTYFYDEHLSHYLWHIGVLGLLALLVYREWKRPVGVATVWWAAGLGGLLYGFLYFCIFLEGQTVPLGLPFAVAFTLFGLVWGRSRLNKQPVLAFFFVSVLIALVLLGGWGIYWRGFPQFSEVGLM